MSVPEYKRRESHASFLMDLATLNSKVVSYSRKKPGYIRKVYMEDIQDAAKDAYTYASMANDIFIKPGMDQELFNTREQYFKNVLYDLKRLNISVDLFYHHITKNNSDMVSKNESKEKLNNQYYTLMNLSKSIAKQINNIMAYDKNLVYKK